MLKQLLWKMRNLALLFQVSSTVERKAHATHAFPVRRITDLQATGAMNLANLQAKSNSRITRLKAKRENKIKL